MADLTANAGATFEAVLDGAPSGLTGVLTVGIYDTPGELVALYGPTTAGIIENPAGSGLYAVTLTAPVAAGVYSVVWNNQGVTTRDTLTVTGSGTYFALSDLRTMDPVLANITKFPDARLSDMRVLVESALEEACAVAFVPRQNTIILSGTGETLLLLPSILLRRAISATDADQADAAIDLTDTRVADDIALWRPGGWPRGTANITITYEHGYDAPPPRVRHAALILAKVWLLTGPITDRATQVPVGDGSVLNLATLGFGIREVDEVVREYKATRIAFA